MAAHRVRLLGGLILALMAGMAIACGQCIEDLVAASYDYGVVLQARRDDLRIAFFEVEGRLAQSPQSADLVATALKETGGVTPGTVRVSISPAATSFAWSDREASLDAIRKTINDLLATHSLHLKLLRTWDSSAGFH